MTLNLQATPHFDKIESYDLRRSALNDSPLSYWQRVLLSVLALFDMMYAHALTNVKVPYFVVRL